MENVTTSKEIGGHSAVWAIRSQIEHCKVHMAPIADQYTIDSLEKDSKYLSIPKSTTTSKKATKEQKLDKHLVFEYSAGDQILGYTAPRSNRFYFVHDPNGGSI